MIQKFVTNNLSPLLWFCFVFIYIYFFFPSSIVVLRCVTISMHLIFIMEHSLNFSGDTLRKGFTLQKNYTHSQKSIQLFKKLLIHMNDLIA